MADPSEKITEVDIMKCLSERVLEAAEQGKRFKHQSSELIVIDTCDAEIQKHKVHTVDAVGSGSLSSLLATPQDTPLDSPLSDVQSPQRHGRLRCLFQRDRPQHVSRQPDSLPFQDPSALRSVFDILDLPISYLQIADGSAALAHSHVFQEADGKTHRFELITHCLTKQGDWAMSLSHNSKTGQTSVFWSVDKRIDSTSLLDKVQTFQHYAHHPMLLPCIMFDMTLQMSVQRRHSIKQRLRLLEDKLLAINHKTYETDPSSPDIWLDGPRDIEHLFELLHSCKRDQGSRKGRYDFWQTYHAAIMTGFQYAEQTLGNDEDFQRINAELKQWTAIVWQKFESLKARDRDHISQVNDASDMLYSLIHQRDSHTQASIARASQRDSEDMKFIALLGSIFLPASLIATVLNVPEFQFLPGAKLFGAYIGITIPFIGVVVTLCVARSHWARWGAQQLRKLRGSRSQTTFPCPRWNQS